jgi:carboxypeptidase PM20D1
MSAAEKSKIFKADISPVVCRMFQTVAATMDQPLKFVLGHPKLFKPALLTAIPKVSGTAGAMLKTTLAFTMASGSEGANVLPLEAWVVGNMRYSHHQGGEASIAAIQELAAKFDIETQVLSRGFTSPLSDPDSDAFRLVERAVSHAYPGVITTPYLMTAASDCRFMSRVSENCLRFVPFKISQQQLDSVHGIDENVDISTLPPAVEFYKYILSESGL